jgi:hypothetical protein
LILWEIGTNDPYPSVDQGCLLCLEGAGNPLEAHEAGYLLLPSQNSVNKYLELTYSCMNNCLTM